MTNKKFFVGMAVLLSVSLFFIGCPTEADTETIRETNTVGKAGDVAGLKALLNDPGVPAVIYLDVLAIATDTIIVPPGKTLIATDGVTLSTGTFVVAGTLNLGDSGINVTGAGTVIGSEAVTDKVTGGSAVTGAIQDGSETITVASTGVTAVVGNITIGSSATSATNIISSGLGTTKLYVFGNVTVSDAISTAPTINVSGNVSVTEDQTAAVVWRIQGNLDAQKLPTTGVGTLTVGGNATFAEAVAGITGAVSIAGSATFEDALTTGAGAVTVGSLTVEGTNATSLGGNLTVGGTASFGGTLGNTAASIATFNGTTTVTGAVTTGTGGLTIAGKGAVTLAEVPVTTTVGLTVKSTGGVTLTPETTIAANIVATKAVIKGTDAAGTPIKSDGTSIVVGAGNSIAVTGEGSSIVVGGSVKPVTITGATLKPGTYTGTDGKLSLSTTAVIEVVSGGKIEITGEGDLELTMAATKVVLNAGSSLDVLAATGKFGEATQTDTKITVAAATDATTATKAKVDADSTTWTVTTDETGTDISASDKIVLGTLTLDFDGTNEVSVDACAVSGTAAAGELIVGADTVITFIGTGS
jgi:hypothetical protein